MNRALSLAAIVILLASVVSSPASAQLPGSASPAMPVAPPAPQIPEEIPNPPLLEDVTSNLDSLISQPVSGIVFEANRGQWDDAALFRVHAQGYDAFITHTGMAMVQMEAPLIEDELRLPGLTEEPPEPTLAWATHLTLVGSNPAPLVTTSQPTEYHTNYFIGNDPTQWHTDVP